MKIKEKDKKEENYKSIIVALLGIVLILAVGSIFVTSQLNQATLAISQAHSQILNLTHSLAQANATIASQAPKLNNLKNLLDLNISKTLYDNYVTIPSGRNVSICGFYGCNPYYQAGNFSISFNIPHAGYLVFNTTNPMVVGVMVEEQYNSTYNIPINVKYLDPSTARMVYATFSSTFLNASINSQAIPVLPGQVEVLIYNYNFTPYYGYLNIKYVS